MLRLSHEDLKAAAATYRKRSSVASEEKLFKIPRITFISTQWNDEKAYDGIQLVSSNY